MVEYMYMYFYSSGLVAFRNTATCRHGKIVEQTRSMRKKDFSGEAVSKVYQNNKA